LYVTRPTLATYTSTRTALEETANELFDIVLSGAVKIEIGRRYRLADAEQVHRDLESRRTSASVIMIP
jgi:NADPH2:quinone reductase